MSIQVDSGEWRSLREIVRLVVRPEVFSVGSSSVVVSSVGAGCVSPRCVSPQLRSQELRTLELRKAPVGPVEVS